MNPQKGFRGRASAKIYSDFVKMSRYGRFPIPAGSYIVIESKMEEEESRYLTVYPEAEWNNDLIINEKKFFELVANTSALEVIANDPRGALRLPQSNLDYLNLKHGSNVCVRGMVNYFEIWKKEVFESFAQMYRTPFTGQDY